MPKPPRSTLFPYTTLFRSTINVYGNTAAEGDRRCGGGLAAEGRRADPPGAGDRQRPGIHGDGSQGGSCPRSEEHTSELQSQFHLVCRLLLEKKKNKLKSLT